MILCIDIGNTHTLMGLFDGERLHGHWRVSTDERRTADEWHVLIRGLLAGETGGPVTGISLCCAVPTIVHEMREMFERHHPGCHAIVVGPGVRTGVPILTDNPREVGADRIVNALAAAAEYGGPCIVVDFGTATTFDVIDAEGRYRGGAIAPGVAISLEALGRRGAQLRPVELLTPRSVIAKNTVEALQSGLVYGLAGQVDGIVDRMLVELGHGPDDPDDLEEVAVIATGGLGDVVVEECRSVTHRDPWLTLIGLRLVFERNPPSP